MSANPSLMRFDSLLSRSIVSSRGLIAAIDKFLGASVAAFLKATLIQSWSPVKRVAVC